MLKGKWGELRIELKRGEETQEDKREENIEERREPRSAEGKGIH